jgi:hypothetical protein
MTLILSGTDGLSDVDGSAATPAIRGTDANTGIFFPAADTIAFSEGGVEAMRIDSSGNVGIGTSSPAKRLSVVNATDATTVGTNSVMTVQAGSSVNSVAEIGFSYGSWSGTNPIASLGYQITSNAGVGSGALTFSTRSVTTDTAPSERMRIDSSGNVGIGTSSPGDKLSVNGACNLGGASGVRIGIGTAFVSGQAEVFSQDSVRFGIGTAGAQPVSFYSNSAERMRIDSSGNLLVGTTTGANAKIRVDYTGQTYGIRVGTTSTSATAIQFVYEPATQVGTITTTTSATNYGSGSDYRLKDDVTALVNALEKVALLKPVNWKWKIDGANGQGFIAHELQEVIPDAVVGEKDAVNEDGSIKPQMVDTSFLVATLTAAIQEQQALITTLTDRITALETPTGTQA